MFRFLRLWLGTILRVFRSRQDLLMESLGLRPQLSVFKRRTRRPTLALDKLFWVFTRGFWSGWKNALIVVPPRPWCAGTEPALGCYWSLISKGKKQVGRKTLSQKVRDLIFQMV